jgi:hypothetical protein
MNEWWLNNNRVKLGAVNGLGGYFREKNMNMRRKYWQIVQVMSPFHSLHSLSIHSIHSPFTLFTLHSLYSLSIHSIHVIEPNQTNQIAEDPTPGLYRLWVFVDDHTLQPLLIKVPRVLFINTRKPHLFQFSPLAPLNESCQEEGRV